MQNQHFYCFTHTVATFSRFRNCWLREFLKVLHDNSGLRFGISKNCEGHYIRRPLDEIPGRS